MQYKNIVTFEVYGDYALFSDPIMRSGGEKCTMQIPTYEALKGILHSIYWKPTFTWIIDSVRIMNPIQTETKGIRTMRYNATTGGLSYYVYLRNVRYQVRAHFIWNENRPELANDRDESKHYNVAKRMIERGGRRDIFLGTRECQGYVEPCVYGEGKGAYDDNVELAFGLMYHGITYADEAYSPETKGNMTMRMWNPTMRYGEIEFIAPDQCKLFRTIKSMDIKPFGEKRDNFIGLDEFDKLGVI